MKENLIYLFAGGVIALAGTIIGPIIVDAIRKRLQRAEIQRAIRTELDELRMKLAGVVHLTYRKIGKVDKQLVAWVKPIVERYHGADYDEEYVAVVRAFAELSDKQIQEAAAASERGREGQALSFKKYTIPLVESHMGSLSIFPETYRSQLLAIKAKLDLLNEEVEQSRFYFQKTFDPAVPDPMLQRIEQNITSQYRTIGTQSKILVEMITELENTQQDTRKGLRQRLASIGVKWPLA